MAINWDLKRAVIEKFGSQIRGAHATGIRESRLSYLIHRHSTPSSGERAALERVFGKARVEQLLAGG